MCCCLIFHIFSNILSNVLSNVISNIISFILSIILYIVISIVLANIFSNVLSNIFAIAIGKSRTCELKLGVECSQHDRQPGNALSNNCLNVISIPL